MASLTELAYIKATTTGIDVEGLVDMPSRLLKFGKIKIDDNEWTNIIYLTVFGWSVGLIYSFAKYFRSRKLSPKKPDENISLAPPIIGSAIFGGLTALFEDLD